MNYKNSVRIIICVLAVAMAAESAAFSFVSFVTLPFKMKELADKKKQGEQITFFDVAGLAMPFGGLAMGKSMFSPFGIVKDSLFFGGKQVMKRHAQKKERRNGRKSDKNTIFGFLPIPFFGLV